MRKVVQIFLKPEGPGVGFDVLFALCDDGSMWMLPRPIGQMGESKWRQIEGVPQEESAEPPAQRVA